MPIQFISQAEMRDTGVVIAEIIETKQARMEKAGLINYVKNEPPPTMLQR
ncbi:MAG: hypothetical protein JST89_13655 [Cyanobacteria bacterium SZAS-4]|nr:hypothetical protein [Cyanobacteria bacterium SZAS-4]